MYLEISYWEITFSSFLVKKKNFKNLHASLHQCFHINFQFSILFELYLLHSTFYEFSYCLCIIYSGMYKDMYIFIILVLGHCYDILTRNFLRSESWKSQQFNSLYLRYKCSIFSELWSLWLIDSSVDSDFPKINWFCLPNRNPQVTVSKISAIYSVFF